jgi:hypothetical protein
MTVLQMETWEKSMLQTHHNLFLSFLDTELLMLACLLVGVVSGMESALYLSSPGASDLLHTPSTLLPLWTQRRYWAECIIFGVPRNPWRACETSSSPEFLTQEV